MKMCLQKKFQIYMLIIIAALTSITACGNGPLRGQRSWHEKCKWDAADFFDDPKVIALCHAIEANDLKEIDRLVADGANVNAKGKGNMTPLLWAFPDDKLDRFKLLLKHGADPNVAITDHFNSHGGMLPGDSVTHLAARTEFAGYFEAVFEHGGDPNLLNKSVLGKNDTPIFSVISGSAPDKVQRVKFLIEKGADPDHIGGLEMTPVMFATGWGGRYDIALALLEAGADHRVYRTNQNSRLVHTVIREESRADFWTPEQKADYLKLVKWLEDHGESIEVARDDFKRWQSWAVENGAYGRKMKEEITNRKAREAGKLDADK